MTPLPGVPGRPIPGAPPPDAADRSGADGAPELESGGFDPLRLCIFATVSLLTWLFGPFAVAVFAGMGLAGYVRARRAGLTRSRCYLRDTRLVLAYLGLLLVVAVAAAGATVWGWIGVLSG